MHKERSNKVVTFLCTSSFQTRRRSPSNVMFSNCLVTFVLHVEILQIPRAVAWLIKLLLNVGHIESTAIKKHSSTWRIISWHNQIKTLTYTPFPYNIHQNMFWLETSPGDSVLMLGCGIDLWCTSDWHLPLANPHCWLEIGKRCLIMKIGWDKLLFWQARGTRQGTLDEHPF